MDSFLEELGLPPNINAYGKVVRKMSANAGLICTKSFSIALEWRKLPVRLLLKRKVFDSIVSLVIESDSVVSTICLVMNVDTDLNHLENATMEEFSKIGREMLKSFIIIRNPST